MDQIMMSTLAQYLTVEDVAEKLAVTPQTVHNWIKDRRLFAVRFSDRVVRIPRRSVEAFTGQSYAAALDEALSQPGNVGDQLRRFEAKYHLSSVEFFRRWSEGEFEEDDSEYGQWALLIDFCRRSLPATRC
jgi:excisionase family DNA binding protein